MTGEPKLEIKDRDDIPILDDSMTLFPRVVQISHDFDYPYGKWVLFGIYKWFSMKEKAGSSCTFEMYRAGVLQIGFMEDVDYFDFLFNWREVAAKVLDEVTK